MDIVDIFSEKYETLYNSVPSDQYIMHQINKRIEDDLHEYNCNEHFMKEVKMAAGGFFQVKSSLLLLVLHGFMDIDME